MNERRIGISALAVLTAVVLTDQAHAQTFDRDPLVAPIAMPTDSLPPSSAEFSAWLDEEAEDLGEEDLVVAREHLFAIISADAKRRVQRGEPPFPSHRDSSLAELFVWADRLRLPGASLVAAALDPSGMVAPSSSRAPPTPGFSLQFDSLYTLVAENDGWKIRFPHYFMISLANRQVSPEGAPVSVAMLSTLFADDVLGASQATVLFVSGSDPAPDMTVQWLQRLGLQLSDTIPAPVPSAVRAYRGTDPRRELTKELVVFMPEGRTILAAYVGLVGTFETNRPHFLDVLKTLRVRSSR